jgi:hypothetical protein
MDDRMTVQAKSVQRKPYTPPKLNRFGDVRQLTRAAGPAGVNKDGGPNNTKSF